MFYNRNAKNFFSGHGDMSADTETARGKAQSVSTVKCCVMSSAFCRRNVTVTADQEGALSPFFHFVTGPFIHKLGYRLFAEVYRSAHMRGCGLLGLGLFGPLSHFPRFDFPTSVLCASAMLSWLTNSANFTEIPLIRSPPSSAILLFIY
jgi:hypothetical protein